jgi:VIT1/CCC1 family predicted Fe2+/Mn2+ transporter
MIAIEHPHAEQHKSQRAPWLRAAVLGVNDGLVSTASLMVGVAAATDSSAAILTAGIAGLVAGALSMAAGEYVSVSSQRDSEQADLDIERRALKDMPKEELAQLTEIYVQRGLEPKLAAQVATQLTAYDALGTHAREELNIDVDTLSRPWLAAFASAGSFTLGAAMPVLAALFAHGTAAAPAIITASLIALAVSGALAAFIGGGHRLVAGLRVFIGGSLAMAITWLIGSLLGQAL